VTALGWAAWQFTEAARIEATISGLSGREFTKEQRAALLDLAHGSRLARWIVSRHTFTRPQQATVFSSRPDEVFLALTGLDPVLARRVVVAHVSADTVNSIDPALRVTLVIVGGGALASRDLQTALKPVLTAITQTQDPDRLSALAAGYKAVADKLPPSDASEALKPVLTAINQAQNELHRVSRRPFCLRPTRQCRSAQAGHNRWPRPRPEGGSRSARGGGGC
jgi:hypothetical protein